MSTTVHVENISQQTGEKEVRDFFSFCGKISNLKVTPTNDGHQSATVTFEKETAAKTALLLDSTQLGPAQVHVTSGKSIDQLAGNKSATSSETESHDIEQEDKPRARIVAEYLAHGYTISDKAIENALALDKQHGISQRFQKTLTDFDGRFKVSENTQKIDEKYGLSQRANAMWGGMNSYFEKALGTPSGQKLRQFYAQGNKQVMDVHNEARHLADLKAQKTGGSGVTAESAHMEKLDSGRTKCNCGGSTASCPCPPGTCACGSCAKNPDEKSTSVSAEEANMEKVGEAKTKCNCGANSGKCPCEPGKCACSSCAKNPEVDSTKAKA